jgi:phosphoribosyl-dephospho-CoA transferase
MEKFEIVSYTDKEIVLSNATQVDKMYRDLHNEEAIQLCWIKDNKKQSVVVITATIAGKVKNNEMIIRSEEVITEMRTV